MEKGEGGRGGKGKRRRTEGMNLPHDRLETLAALSHLRFESHVSCVVRACN